MDERENLDGGEGSCCGGREQRRPVCPPEAAFDSRCRIGNDGRCTATPPTVADASTRAGWWRAVVPDSGADAPRPVGLERDTLIHLQVCYPAEYCRATGEAAGAAAAHLGSAASAEPLGGSRWPFLSVAAGAQGETAATPAAHQLAASTALVEHVVRRAEKV